MVAGLVYYRGGPKDGRLLLGTDEGAYLVFQEGAPPWPRYRLTDEMITIDGKTYPIADYVPPES